MYTKGGKMEKKNITPLWAISNTFFNPHGLKENSRSDGRLKEWVDLESIMEIRFDPLLPKKIQTALCLHFESQALNEHALEGRKKDDPILSGTFIMVNNNYGTCMSEEQLAQVEGRYEVRHINVMHEI